MPTPSRQGFTLVELSLVLVIIGLIVGGVLVGRDLIRTSELRAIVSDVTNFKTALNTFKEKYGYYPGDFPQASSVWPNCYSPPSACDGNGNDIINDAGAPNEGRMAWKQLSDAGLIPGNYSGVAAANQNLGDNVPYAGINKGYYHFLNYNTPFTLLGLSSYVSSTGTWYGASLSPGDAFYVDTKLDNGMPRTGIVTATDGYNVTGCLNGSVGLKTSTYMTTADVTCIVYFGIGTTRSY